MAGRPRPATTTSTAICGGAILPGACSSEEVAALAQAHFAALEIVDMPANNLSLVFRRQPSS